jgi:hypothetical protein
MSGKPGSIRLGPSDVFTRVGGGWKLRERQLCQLYITSFIYNLWWKLRVWKKAEKAGSALSCKRKEYDII